MQILWVSGQKNLHFKQNDEWCATEINCCSIITEKIASAQKALDKIVTFYTEEQ